MRPRLLVLSGPLKDSTVPLSEGEITIGREASNGIAISDPSVSRKHCLLTGQDGRFLVRDLDSRNGTLVNRAAVDEQWLQHGDEIAAGDSSFLFLLEEEEISPAEARVEFEDALCTAETTILHPRDVVYLQPDRLLRELPATSRLARNLNALLKISRVVHAIRDLNQLQEQLLDLIFEVAPAGRGAILLADREGHQFNSMFARMRQAGEGQLVKVSRTVARQVLEQGVAVLGSVAALVYRMRLELPTGLPRAVASRAGTGLAQALQTGSPVAIHAARDAYLHGLHAVGWIVVATAASVAVLSGMFLRGRSPR